MPSSDEILRWCNPLVCVLELRLQNTIGSEWGFEDVPGGQVPVAGFNPDVEAAGDNSLARLSSGNVYNGVTSDVILNGVQYQRSLGDWFDSAATTSISKMSVDFLHSSDNLHFRDMEYKPYELKIGGHYKPKTAEAERLRYDDYVTWVQGRTINKDFDEKQMGVYFSTEPPQLSNSFPRGLATGSAADETIPLVIGEPRLMQPLVVTATTGKWGDGDLDTTYNGIQTAYDLAGNELTLEAGDPTTDTVSASDKYMADALGNVAWHSDVSGVILEVQGIKPGGVYSNKANVLIEEIVRLATDGTVTVNYDFDGDAIGWVFYEQKPIKEHVQDILRGLDCYYTHDEATNSITIKRRYNARAYDLDGTANNRAAFALGKEDGFSTQFKYLRAVKRPKSVTFRYNRNFSPIQRSNLVDNRVELAREWHYTTAGVFEGREAELMVDSALILDADADAYCQMAADRYGIKAWLCQWVEPVMGLGVYEGDVGTYLHRLVNTNVFTEIRSVQVNTLNKQTVFGGIVYG